MLTTLFERRATKSSAGHPRDPALAELLGYGTNTAAKIPIDEETAMKFSAVYASIRVIAETKASLPIQVFERLPNGKRAKVTMHPVNDLLHVLDPNPDMTRMVCQEVRQAHVLGWGNSFAEITFNGKGEPTAIRPKHPSRVRPFRDRATGRIMYEVYQEDGGTVTLDASEVLHVPGFGFNGITGKSPLRLFAESIAIGLAEERFVGSFFARSAKPSVIIKMPEGKQLGDVAAKDIRTQWESFSGENAHRPALVDNGADVQLVTMPLNEAQLLESRKFQAEDIGARVYRIPPHVLGLLDRATFSNIESQDGYFEKHTMRPWLERDEQELNRKLFSREERRRFFVRHNVNALLRADIKTRFEAYKTAIQNGWKSANDVLELEDENGIGLQGDLYLVPQNMQPASVVVQLPGADKPQQEEDEDEDEQDERSRKLAESHRRLLVDMLESLIRTESKRVREAARKPDEFPSRVEAFYASHREVMTRKLGLVADADTVARLVTAHVEESRRQLSVVGRQADGLESRVETITEKWLALAEPLAAEILGE